MIRVCLLLFVTATAMAEVPKSLGGFEGVLLTGASLRQKLSLHGGTLSQCELHTSMSSEIHKCVLSDARIDVEGEHYDLQRVVVLKSLTGGTIHHYIKGTRTIQVGDRNLTRGIL